MKKRKKRGKKETKEAKQETKTKKNGEKKGEKKKKEKRKKERKMRKKEKEKKKKKTVNFCQSRQRHCACAVARLRAYLGVQMKATRCSMTHGMNDATMLDVLSHAQA